MLSRWIRIRLHVNSVTADDAEIAAEYVGIARHEADQTGAAVRSVRVYRMSQPQSELEILIP